MKKNKSTTPVHLGKILEGLTDRKPLFWLLKVSALCALSSVRQLLIRSHVEPIDAKNNQLQTKKSSNKQAMLQTLHYSSYLDFPHHLVPLTHQA